MPPSLSVVIPAFNEETRIIPSLESVVAYLRAQSYSWELLVVDNGSTDSTRALVEGWALGQPGVRMETIADGGKGWAVRHGMLAATGEYRFMCDADLAMPIDGVGAFLQRMEDGYDIVIGSRQIAGARRFNEPAVRHAMGRAFNRFVRLAAVRDIDDTQCGFKCFRGDVAEQLFGMQRTKGFAFDVEVLYLARKRGFRILELPIDWHHQRDSKVRPGADSFRMFRDTLSVRWHDALGRYDAPRRAEGHAGRSVGLQARDGSDAATAVGAKKLAVVVPTYNEAANLPQLAERLFGLGIPNTTLIVVDDSSPDGTADVAETLAEELSGRVEVIRRGAKQGLGTAYVDGFRRALAGGADYVVQMDADLSHAPEYIPEFLRALEQADVVVGSRYAPGGGTDKTWSVKRRLLSVLSNYGIRAVGGIDVKDATSGFKAYRADALSSLELGRLQCKGFGFQVEVAKACQRQGHKVVEQPILFVDRVRGESKMSLSIVAEASWRLLLLRWRR